VKLKRDGVTRWVLRVTSTTRSEDCDCGEAGGLQNKYGTGKARIPLFVFMEIPK
jgi:hypothetical protein